MKKGWRNFTAERPENGQEVLINCADGFHVAIFDAVKDGFRLRGGAFLDSRDCEIHWMPIIFP